MMRIRDFRQRVSVAGSIVPGMNRLGIVVTAAALAMTLSACFGGSSKTADDCNALTDKYASEALMHETPETALEREGMTALYNKWSADIDACWREVEG